MDINENNFSFNEREAPKPRASISSPNSRGIVGFLIKKGIVKNQSHANILLILVTIGSFLVAGFIFAKTFDIEIGNDKSTLPKNNLKTYEK